MSEKETNQTAEEKPKKEKKAKKGKKEKKEKKEKAPQVKICPNCEAEIPKKAKVCPNCEAKQKGGNKLLLILVPIIVLLAAASVSIAVFSFPVALPFLSSVSDTMLGQAMGLSSKQEEAVLAVLAECGFQALGQNRHDGFPYFSMARETAGLVSNIQIPSIPIYRSYISAISPYLFPIIKRNAPI